jgi:hypothetical protein
MKAEWISFNSSPSSKECSAFSKRNVYVAPDNGHMIVVQIPANGYISHIRRSAPSMVLDRPLKCYLTLLGKLVG